jgi:hypothetical protein
MATLASSLLDFILDLLRDPEAADAFEADPTGTLAAAGLDDVCPADVLNARMVLDELPPAGVVPTSVAGVTPVATTQFTAAAVPPVAAATTTTQVSDATADADTDSVVEQLRYIQQTFTYEANTTIDIRDSVWAGKDVYQLFGDDSVMAAPGGIAAGGDVEDVELDNSVEIEDSFNIDDSFNPENSGNTQTGTGNVNGHGADVDLDNSGNEVDDSTGVVIGNGGEIENATSGVGNVVGNDLEVDVRDSGNDNSASYDDSFNETDTDLEFEIEESFNEVDNSSDDDLTVRTEDILIGEDNVGGDAPTTIEESGNTNTEVSDFLNDATVAVDESIAARENDVEL